MNEVSRCITNHSHQSTKCPSTRKVRSAVNRSSWCFATSCRVSVHAHCCAHAQTSSTTRPRPCSGSAPAARRCEIRSRRMEANGVGSVRAICDWKVGALKRLYDVQTTVICANCKTQWPNCDSWWTCSSVAYQLTTGRQEARHRRARNVHTPISSAAAAAVISIFRRE